MQGSSSDLPEVRVADSDRQRVADVLRRHTTDGRLTIDEFSERLGLALAARTRADLDSLTSDLPLVPEPPVDSKRKKVRRWVVGIMSEAAVKGRWRTGESVTAVTVMGSCVVDFCRAEIDHDEVKVTAIALMGGIHVIVPEGTDVELSGLPIMGSKHIRIADVPPTPGSPRIIVRAFPIMGAVHIRSEPGPRNSMGDQHHTGSETAG